MHVFELWKSTETHRREHGQAGRQTFLLRGESANAQMVFLKNSWKGTPKGQEKLCKTKNNSHHSFPQ